MIHHTYRKDCFGLADFLVWKRKLYEKWSRCKVLSSGTRPDVTGLPSPFGERIEVRGAVDKKAFPLTLTLSPNGERP
jgi:hypothetical protein